MKVEVSKGLQHPIEVSNGEHSTMITVKDAKNLISELVQAVHEFDSVWEFYEPLYKAGDVLVNSEGKEIKILNIVADQYMYEDASAEINPLYEFCSCIDFWFCTKKKWSEELIVENSN